MTDAPTNSDDLIGIEDLMHSAYLQYSLSVNVGRAIPDVRDGLKPVNRRILYAMRVLNLSKSRPHSKCAKVVGEVIGNYHPHGDQAVYDALVRMAQDFNMRHPLVDGQGNFGNIDGDAPAAYRYTECRMERLAEEMLADLDKETVDMQLTFDETTQEPSILPARVPNLLVNGAMGIGVGMATNIPPHNLGEVIDAAVRVIDEPGVTCRGLMEHVKGPDFPTGASIMGVNPICQLYETGHGIIRLRGRAELEDNNGRERIVITEIPYAVNKERLVKNIADLVNDKRIEGISNIVDESSSRAGIRVVIDIKRNGVGTVVLNQLYAHTALETSIGAQFLVVDRNRPKTMNLKQVLQAYLDHRLEVVTRRAQFELRKAEARAHILEGLLIAVDNIDETVRIIRQSRTRQEAAVALIERFDLSQVQTNAILDMRLHQLTGLAMEELRAEYGELIKKIEELKSLLASRELRMGVVREELIGVKEKYATERLTDIQPSENEFNIEDLIERTACLITLSKTGYIKRVPASAYRTQNRNTMGVRGMQTKDEDEVHSILSVCTHDYVMFFTNFGRMHWLKAYEVPEGGRDSGGKAIINLLELDEAEVVRTMLTVNDVDVEGANLVMATAMGVVKKTALSNFKHMRRKGIRAIDLQDNDDLIDVGITDGKQEILLSTQGGRACRFKEADVREMGRTARGVRGMELRGENGENTTRVVSMSIVDPTLDLMVITAHGMGKRTHLGAGISEQDKEIGGGYRLTKRGGKGVTSIKLNEGDYVVTALQVTGKEELLITTQRGQTVRIAIDEIRAVGRASKGVRIMKLREGDAIIAVSPVAEVEQEAAEAEAKENAVDSHVENPQTDANVSDEEKQTSQTVDAGGEADEGVPEQSPDT